MAVDCGLSQTQIWFAIVLPVIRLADYYRASNGARGEIEAERRWQWSRLRPLRPHGEGGRQKRRFTQPLHIIVDAKIGPVRSPQVTCFMYQKSPE